MIIPARHVFVIAAPQKTYFSIPISSNFLPKWNFSHRTTPDSLPVQCVSICIWTLFTNKSSRISCLSLLMMPTISLLIIFTYPFHINVLRWSLTNPCRYEEFISYFNLRIAWFTHTQACCCCSTAYNWFLDNSQNWTFYELS